MAGSHHRTVPRTAGVSRIPIDADLAELDRLMADSAPKVIATGGFTVADMMARYNLKVSTAKGRIHALIISGDVEEVGIRPGRGMQKVYKTVAPTAQGK